MKKKYLVVYPQNSGIAQLNNFGIFDAYTAAEAFYMAQEVWNTTYSELEVYDLDTLEPNWSYYV